MPMGGGRYGDICSRALEEADAQGVIMIVINGNHGNGFSIAVEEGIVLNVPGALRALADEIDKDLGVGNPQ